MNNKHSPAPWRIEMLYSNSADDDVSVLRDATNRPIFLAENEINKEDDALIAAAPDLLEVLKRVKARLELSHNCEQDRVDDQTYHMVCAAINKAGGSHDNK